MLVYAKLLYNGAEGAVLENFTLKFENCNDFASFFWFWPKNFPGGVPKSQGGCPVIENFPRGVAPPCTPPVDPPLAGKYSGKRFLDRIMA